MTAKTKLIYTAEEITKQQLGCEGIDKNKKFLDADEVYRIIEEQFNKGSLMGMFLLLKRLK